MTIAVALIVLIAVLVAFGAFLLEAARQDALPLICFVSGMAFALSVLVWYSIQVVWEALS